MTIHTIWPAGIRFLGNIRSSHVHDLKNETRHCYIEKVYKAGYAVPFRSLDNAHNHRFKNCPHCLDPLKNKKTVQPSQLTNHHKLTTSD